MSQLHGRKPNRGKTGDFAPCGAFDADMFAAVRDAIREHKKSGMICPHCEQKVPEYEIHFAQGDLICDACFKEENK